MAIKEGDEVVLTVARSQGRFREVHIHWNLSVGAFPDVYPANGTLTFDDVSFIVYINRTLFNSVGHSRTLLGTDSDGYG